MSDTAMESQQESVSIGSLKKLLKKLRKLFAKLGSYITIASHTIRMTGKLKVSIIGPPGAGKTSLLAALVAIAMRGFTNVSKGLETAMSAHDVQPTKDPHIHPAVSHHAEFAEYPDTIMYAHAGEMLRRPSEARRVDYLNYRRIYKQHRGRPDKLLVLTINPLLLPDFATRAFYHKLDSLMNANPDADITTLVADTAEVLFECQREQFQSAATEILNYTETDKLSDDQEPAEIDQYFADCHVDMDTLSLQGGAQAELASYLIDSFVRLKVTESQPYIEALRYLSRLPNAVFVCTHHDQAGFATDTELLQALLELDVSDRCHHDRILVSSRHYSRVAPGAKRLPVQPTHTDGNAIAQLAQRIRHYAERSSLLRRARVCVGVASVACLGLALGISLAGGLA